MTRLIPTRLRGRRRETQGQAVILMYHSISCGRPDPWGLCVDPTLFAEHLRLLRDEYHVVRLGELRRALVADEPLSRAVVVTFDDGYRDNLLVAKPLLEEHGLSATVFVATGYIDSGRDFWWDELEALCAAADHASRPLWDELQTMSAEARSARLDELWASVAGERPTSSLALGGAELERLADGGTVELGAHTVTHPHLSTLSVDRQRDEIETSRAYLAEISGGPIEAFAFPHGDFSKKTASLVRTAGFATACTTRSAPVTRRTDRFGLPRLQVGDWDSGKLEHELERLLA